MTYQLLEAFAALFQGKKYFHRDSTQGDLVAMRLFEDLYALNRSPKYKQRVDSARSVLNAQNKRHGVKARRGDGTFGEIVPNVVPRRDPGFEVARGSIATIEIGIEIKILAKAMIKQIDKVINDLDKQEKHFETRGGNPITVGIVGINHAEQYLSYERDREYLTNGTSGYRHPIQEAAEAERRLIGLVGAIFDEFLILRFAATNQPPHSFWWVNAKATDMDYGAGLVRISQQYEKRF